MLAADHFWLLGFRVPHLHSIRPYKNLSVCRWFLLVQEACSVSLAAQRDPGRGLGCKGYSPQDPHVLPCSADKLLALRASLNEALAPSGGKLSLNDFIIKACALVGALCTES